MAFALIIVAVVACIVIIAGSDIARRHKNDSSGVNTSSLGPNTGSFSDCAKHGGTLDSIASGGGEQPATAIMDYEADSLSCQEIGNHTRTKQVWFASKEPDFDARCKVVAICASIEAAAKQLCSPDYGVAANTLDPTFLYLPLIKGDFARLQLTDCSSFHYRQSVISYTFLKKTNGAWHIEKFVAKDSCSASDQADIPQILFYKCI